MGGKKSIYLACAVIILSGFAGLSLSDEMDSYAFGKELEENDHMHKHVIEVEFDLEFERDFSGGRYYQLPYFEGSFYRSSGPGYAVPYKEVKIPIMGEVEDLDVEFLNPFHFKIDPVPYPQPKKSIRQNVTDSGIPESYEIPAQYFHDVEKDLLSEKKTLSIMVSPVSYDENGKMTFYENVRIEYQTVPEKFSVEVDVLPGHKPTGDISYLIITTEELKDSLKTFAGWKSQKGMFTHVETVESITKKYSGRDDPEKIRNYLTDYNERYEVDYLLLAGDYDDVPVRETKNPKVLIPNVEPDYFASDIYYACVDPNTTWDKDKDGVYGEIGDIEDPDLDMVYGRLAIGSPNDMSKKLSELISREKNPVKSTGGNEILILANELGHDLESVDITEAIIDRHEALKDSKFDKVYFDGSGDELFTTEKLIERLEDGYQFNFYLGHGDPDGYQGEIYNEDVKDFNQEELGGYLFAMSCLTGWFDDPDGFKEHTFDDCIAETFTETEGKGLVGYSGSNRLAISLSTDRFMGDSNGMMELAMWASAVVADGQIDQTAGVIHALAMKEFARKFDPFNDPHKTEIRAFLSYNYFGDPEAPLIIDEPEELVLSFELSESKDEITAVVRNRVGDPQSGVNVTLYREGELGIKGETGDDGAVTIRIPPNNGGKINITAYKAGDIPDMGEFHLPDNLEPKPMIRTEPEWPEGDNSIYLSIPKAYVYTNEEATLRYRINDGEEISTHEEEEIFLLEGTNTIEVKATDTAGHESGWYGYEIRVDLKDPDIDIRTYPEEPDGKNGWFVSDTHIEVIPTEELSVINISIDEGKPIDLAEPLKLMEGIHNYTIRGKDLSGRTVEINRSYKLDREAPMDSRMEVSRGPDGKNGFYRTAPLIEFKVFDDDAHIEYRWDGGDLEVAEGPLEPMEGIHLLEWLTVDEAGNIGNIGNRTFKVDTEDPDLEFELTPKESDGKSGYYITSPVLTADSEEGQVEYSIVPIGGDADWSKGQIIPGEGITVPDGEWSLYIKSEDEAGNTEVSDRIDLRIDTTDPDMEVFMNPSEPDGDNAWFREPVVIEPDAGEENLEVKITLDGNDWSPFRNPVYLTDGIYDVKIKASDEAGNLREYDLGMIKIDIGVPVISSVGPKPGSEFGKEPVRIYWEASDLVSEDLKSFISIDRGIWTETEGMEYIFSDLKNGEHEIAVKVLDEAGNLKIAYTSIVVDSSSPAALSFTPSGEIESEDIQIVIHFSEDMDTESSVLIVNGNEEPHYWTGDRTLMADLGDLPKGEEFTVSVIACDIHENQMEDLEFFFETEEDTGNTIPEENETADGGSSSLIPMISVGLIIAAAAAIGIVMVVMVVKRK